MSSMLELQKVEVTDKEVSALVTAMPLIIRVLSAVGINTEYLKSPSGERNDDSVWEFLMAMQEGAVTKPRSH